MDFQSESLTKVKPRSRLLLFGPFLVKMCRVFILLRLILLSFVNLKRFAAALFVFNFGIFIYLRSYFRKLFRINDYYDLLSVLNRIPFHRTVFFQVLNHSINNFHSEVGMHHLPTAKSETYFDFIALSQKLLCVFLFDFVIVTFDPRTNFNFFNVDYVLFFFASLLFLSNSNLYFP